MRNKLKFTGGLLIALALVVPTLHSSWNYYKTHCPSRDVLSWDGNLRMIGVIDQYQDFRQGKVGRAFLSLLDAPTWPALRSVITLVVFALSPTGPNTVVEAFISFTFFFLLFPSVFYIAWKMTGSLAGGSVVYFIVALLLIHTQELPLYSLSAMLETQGMFFTLWSCYFVYRLHAVPRLQLCSRRTRLLLGAGLFFSLQGVFHTKYPYGVMALIAVFGLEALRAPGTYRRIALILYRRRYRGWRVLVIVLMAAVLAVLALTGQLGDAAPRPKLFKQIVFLMTYAVLIEFTIYVYTNRLKFRAILPRELKLLYFTGFLPALIWLMHPTRFSTTLGTQQRIISEPDSDSFVRIFFFRNFDFEKAAAALALAAVGALALQLLRNLRTNRERALGLNRAAQTSAQTPVTPVTFAARLRTFGAALAALLRDPLAAPLLLILLQLLMLEFATVNKQKRHIYHLVPALTLLLTLWAARLTAMAGSFPKRKTSFRELIASRANLAPAVSTLVALTFVICCVASLFEPPGMLSGKYFESRPFCFSGTQDSVYVPARELAARIDPKRKYVLLNLAHEQIAPFIATPADLFLRMRALRGGGDVRNDSKHLWPTWDEFDSVLLLSKQCDDAFREPTLARRLRETGSQAARTKRTASAHYCLDEYAVQHGK